MSQFYFDSKPFRNGVAGKNLRGEWPLEVIM